MVDLDGDAQPAGPGDEVGGLLDGLGPPVFRLLAPGGAPGDIDGGPDRPQFGRDASARSSGRSCYECDGHGPRSVGRRPTKCVARRAGRPAGMPANPTPSSLSAATAALVGGPGGQGVVDEGHQRHRDVQPGRLRQQPQGIGVGDPQRELVDGVERGGIDEDRVRPGRLGFAGMAVVNAHLSSGTPLQVGLVDEVDRLGVATICTVHERDWASAIRSGRSFTGPAAQTMT